MVLLTHMVVLWLILCNTYNGIMPLSNCLSKLISKKLFVSRLCGVCTEIHVIALCCKVHWPLVLASCLRTGGAILRAKVDFNGY